MKNENRQSTLTQNQIHAWLTLWRIPGVGFKLLNKAYKQFENISDIFTEKNHNLTQLGFSESQLEQLKNPPWKDAEQELNWLTEDNHHLRCWFDDDYPELLRQITNPPPFLLINGDPDLLLKPQLAMVGSRNPSHSGVETAYRFAADLSQAGLIVTSGMAMGIDAACHRGALSVDKPTIAVWGTGPNKCYPKLNRELAVKIREHGAIVSEFPLNVGPMACNFPRRNRIISGLSLGTLVVEATIKSGSLITAYKAVEQNREVFAIPGSIHNPLAKGNHQILREGAKLTETLDDILAELPGDCFQATDSTTKSQLNPTENHKELASAHRKLLQCIDHEATSIDSIAGRSGLTIPEIAPILYKLEQDAFIKQTTQGYHKIA